MLAGQLQCGKGGQYQSYGLFCLLGSLQGVGVVRGVVCWREGADSLMVTYWMPMWQPRIGLKFLLVLAAWLSILDIDLHV